VGQFLPGLFRRIIRNPPHGSAPAEARVEADAARLLKQIRAHAEADRKATFVSCWHANDGESEALWRLYCPLGSTGVAIETTAERLSVSLGDSDIELGRVQYVDFRKSFAGLHDRIFWKRSSLRHEAEVRAVFKQSFSRESTGVHRLIDLDRLCVSVVPSPFAGSWFDELIQSVAKTYGYKLNISKSELLSHPFF